MSEIYSHDQETPATGNLCFTPQSQEKHKEFL